MLKDYRFILTLDTILFAIAMAWGRHQAQFNELKKDFAELKADVESFSEDLENVEMMIRSTL